MGAGATATWNDHPCSNDIEHRPRPMRVVEHHIQPTEAGGSNTPENKIWICDVDHYNIHRLMWMMRNGQPIGSLGDPFQRRIAAQGYAACVAAGTIQDIPNEG